MSERHRVVTVPFSPPAGTTVTEEKEKKLRKSKCCFNLPVVIALLLLLNLAWLVYTHYTPAACDSPVPVSKQETGKDKNNALTWKAYVPVPVPAHVQVQTLEKPSGVKFDAEHRKQPDEGKMQDLIHLISSINRVNVKKPTFLKDTKQLPPLADPDSVYWRFTKQLSNYGLYLPQTTDDGKLIDDLLHSMATSPVDFLESVSDKGTELKLFARFKDGTEAVMKPQRMERDEEVGVDIWYNAERERHYAEIAASHLDRIFGFARAPPCVGRLFNITSEIVPFVDDTLLWSLHRSPGGNLCYYGKCRYLCDLFHPVCGKPDVVEYSVCVYVQRDLWPTKNRYSPWRRSYNYHYPADWQEAENNDTYCEKTVLTDPEYKQGRTLLDLVDCLVFDFLTGNEDRHSYNKFSDIFNISTLVNYDNGRAFGRPYRDVMDSLAPLYQCCMLRRSTYDKLKLLAENEDGITLSDLMRYTLSKDPLAKIAPILTDRLLEALDRRVRLIFETIDKDCLQKKNLRLEQVLIDDGF